MQRKINNTVICLRMGKNLMAKTLPGDFQVTAPKTPLLSQQAVTSKGILSTLPTYSWTLTLIPNWTCFVVTVLLSDARLPSKWLIVAWILVRDLFFCTNPSMWLTPHQPFDCCSWFAAASHRNTNKIFNVGVRDFAWLQNPKAYKKRSKNSFFYRRRLGFQKENLMKLSRVRFFFFPPPLNRSLMGSPIQNRFTQTLGFPSPIRIIQTHKQIAF